MRTKLAKLFVALTVLSGGVAAADTRSSTEVARDHRVTEVAPAPVQVARRDDNRDDRRDARDDQRDDRRDDRRDAQDDRRDRRDDLRDAKDDRRDARDDRRDQRNDRRDARADRADRDDIPRTAPPAAPLERVRARRGYVFVAGNYQYQAGRWTWIPGHYERKLANQQYRNGSWTQQGDRFVWNAGGWVSVGHRR